MSGHLLNAIRGLAQLHASYDDHDDAQRSPDYYAAALHLGLSEAQAERAERAIAGREKSAQGGF